MTHFSNFVIVVLSISTHMALSMDPGSQEISRFNVEESTLNIPLSTQTCTRNVQRGKLIKTSQNIMKNQNQSDKDLALGNQSLNKDLLKQPQLRNPQPSSKVRLASQVWRYQDSIPQINKMREGHVVPEFSPIDQAGSKGDETIGSNKRKKIVEKQKQQEGNSGLDYQSQNIYLSKQSHKLIILEKMQKGYPSNGPKIKTSIPTGTTSNQSELTSASLRLTRPSLKGHLSSKFSSSKGSIPHSQKMSAGQCATNQIPPDWARTEQTPRINSKKGKWGIPSHHLQMAHTSLKKIASGGRKNKDHYISKGNNKLPNISKIEHTSVERTQGIDIQKFYLHVPDKMCSAAALHFTKDLMQNMEKKYLLRNKQSKYPTWDAGQQLWTPNTLLPFVYFVVSCNPNMRIWEHIKNVTAYTLKVYHHCCAKAKNCSDQEKLAQFLLWHTDVIYHITKLGPKIESSGGEIKKISSLKLTTPGLSPLARTFSLIHSDEAYENFMQSTARKHHTLERYVSKTFENDYQKGYPNYNTNQRQHVPVWKDWKEKSYKITITADNVQWPILHSERNDSEPILLLSGEIEDDMRLQKDKTMFDFIKMWRFDFKRTMKFTKMSQSEKSNFPPYSVKDFSRGIHTFLQEKNHAKRSKFQVNLFSEFIHQDSQTKFYTDFWIHFEALENKKLKNVLNTRNRNHKIET
ncbi:hypothetical protein DFH28DRAFT_1104283 [Melampsora americana]|nr:hypothetical protein DFH28DRAFT_1104283 [Melampsora americana]